MLVRARVGSRVLVRFGTRKVTGVVVREHVVPPEGITPLDVSDVLDEEPALPRELVELCLWVAEYYEAPPGEALRAALPAGSGIAARGVVTLTEAGRAIAEGEGAALPPKQRAFLSTLLEGDVRVAGLGKLRPVVDALATAGLVQTREHRDAARARLKRERVAQLAVPLAEAREATGRSPKQYAVIEQLAAGDQRAIAELAKLVPNAQTAIRELAKQGLVRITEREVTLEAVAIGEAMHVSPPPELTAEQAHRSDAKAQRPAPIAMPPARSATKPRRPEPMATRTPPRTSGPRRHRMRSRRRAGWHRAVVGSRRFCCTA
jgi:primosomal protein N' (replication factor Y)